MLGERLADLSEYINSVRLTESASAHWQTTSIAAEQFGVTEQHGMSQMPPRSSLVSRSSMGCRRCRTGLCSGLGGIPVEKIPIWDRQAPSFCPDHWPVRRVCEWAPPAEERQWQRTAELSCWSTSQVSVCRSQTAPTVTAARLAARCHAQRQVIDWAISAKPLKQPVQACQLFTRWRTISKGGCRRKFWEGQPKAIVYFSFCYWEALELYV